MTTTNKNVTKEGVEVKCGQVWRDLDKRMHNRHVLVISLSNGKATVQACSIEGRSIIHTTTKLSVSRMHKSSTGFVLVLDAK